MFRSGDEAILKDELDVFQVPMFIAERGYKARDFRILALNRSYERVSGLMHDEAAQQPLPCVFPAHQAKEMSAKFATALRSDAPIRYKDVLTMPDGVQTYDTTIRRIDGIAEGERIFGVALLLREQAQFEAQLAFDDVRFFSTEASFQLSRVTQSMEALRTEAASPAQLRASIELLANICRAVDSSLQDIRNIAEMRLKDTPSASRALLHAPEHPNRVTEAANCMIALLEAPQPET